MTTDLFQPFLFVVHQVAYGARYGSQPCQYHNDREEVGTDVNLEAARSEMLECSE